MRIFLVTSNAPGPKGEAIEVVVHEVIRLAARLNHSVVVQVILRDLRGSAASVHAEQVLNCLHMDNVLMYQPLYISDSDNKPPRTRSGPIGKAINLMQSLRVAEMFPASRLGSQIEARVLESQADVILSVWSWEALAATYRIRHIPKFAYYGNPDHLPEEARLRNPELFELPLSTVKDKRAWRLARLKNLYRKYLHIRMMKQVEVTANNSILDVQFYARKGHPNSIYLQNMWPAVGGGDEEKSVAFKMNNVVKIIGSIGNLGATGNTFALHYIGTELLVRLEERFAGRAFEIHILGKGSPKRSVARYLDAPRIIRRGWVDDVESEFRSSHVFLVMTNVSKDFLVGNTRILLAWALRTCVIMHANSALAMPEIEHGKNALLGGTPDEIADLIVQVASDDTLRHKIGEGGYETFQTFYRSDVVVPKMLTLLEQMVQNFAAGFRT